MRKLVSCKTVLAVVSAGMLSMSILADAADAHTGFRDDWIMGTHSGQHGSYESDKSYERNNDSSNSATVMSGGMRAGNEVPLDGTYTKPSPILLQRCFFAIQQSLPLQKENFPFP